MTSPEKEKWLKASEAEFEGLTKMGIWKLVERLRGQNTIKFRWTYVLKSDGCYKAYLVVKGYTQVQGNCKFAIQGSHLFASKSRLLLYICFSL